LVGVTLGAALVAAYPLSHVPPLLRNSALVGWLISLAVCASSGFLAFWSLDHSSRTFMLVTFGGMVVRMAVVGVAVVLAILVGRVHVTAFVIGLLGAYTVYHALEVLMLNLHRSAASRQATTGPPGGSA